VFRKKTSSLLGKVIVGRRFTKTISYAGLIVFEFSIPISRLSKRFSLALICRLILGVDKVNEVIRKESR